MSNPIRYQGGWSDRSIGAWLHQQGELKAIELGELVDLEALMVTPDVLVIAFLTEKQRAKRTVEASARVSRLQAKLALGGEALAAELGAPFPSVVVAHREGQPWALLRPPLTPLAIESFLKARALPLVVPMGDSERRFSKHARDHPTQLQAILVHTSGARGVHEESDETLAEAREAAAKLAGVVLFISYDFFDNDPDQFSTMSLFSADLPALVVVHDRGGLNERSWRIKGEGHAIYSDQMVGLVRRALKESDLPSESPPGWEELPAPSCLQPRSDGTPE